MSVTPEAAAPSATIARFTDAERFVHRLTAALMIVCILTAAVLYNGSLAIRVGHRRQVELVHVCAGFALPVPMLLGFACGGRGAKGAGSPWENQAKASAASATR